MKVSFQLVSQNRKTGSIPVSMTEKKSCPDSCQLKKEKSCYAMYSNLNIFWTRLSRLKNKLTWNSKTRNIFSWSEFLAMVRRLPKGQLWRHNQAGDLPGTNENIDKKKFLSLVQANKGRHGFSYSHKNVLGNSKQAKKNRELIKYANENGFVVNVSGDDPGRADSLYDLSIAPVVVVLPSDAKNGVQYKTPKGRKIVTCPETRKDIENNYITCSTCQLCAIPNRKSLIGFPSHGVRKNHINERLRIIQ